MASTLLLDIDLWDLVADANGNIAVASDPYSVVQDVASACRVFVGDMWYDETDGIPYFENILGVKVSLAYIKAQMVAAANSVPGCSNAIVYFSGINGRKLTGQVQFTDDNGQIQAVTL